MRKSLVVSGRYEYRIISESLDSAPFGCNLSFHNPFEKVFLSADYQGDYVLETGSISLEGKASDLLSNEEVKKAYLGG